MAGAIIILVAIAMAVHGLSLRQKERRLLARLEPVEAKLLDPGQKGEVVWNDEDYQRDLQELHSSQIHGGEPRTQMPTRTNSTVYTASWEYEVKGKSYRTVHKQGSPVFERENVRAGRVQVYYDRDNPAFSRPNRQAIDSSRSFLIASVVVAMVGVLLAGVARITEQRDRAYQERLRSGAHN